MKETYRNYFGPKTAAARYATGRPRFHPFVIDKIRQYLSLENPLSSVLDVGCGTGLSSVALQTIAEKITGIDISEAMLAHADNHHGIAYCAASAENLPFNAGEFDLVTISQAIHWIDKTKFFAEAGRVLKAEAIIAAYDNYFQGRMLENPSFSNWFKTDFLENYPTPPRGARAFAPHSDNQRDFVLEHQESNENTLEFSAEELVSYLLTISNVIAKVENGTQTVGEAADRLKQKITPFFDRPKMSFLFVNPIWYLRRND